MFKRMDMNRSKWSDDELEILKEKYPEIGTECSSLFIGKSKSAIRAKAIRLNIKFNGRDAWTDEEVNKLEVAWGSYDMDKLLESFPGRTYKKIMAKASLL